MKKINKVLSIAGFDGSGGAGIQADLKTMSALSCYVTTALTAIPIQNTMKVKSIYTLETNCIEEQILTILEDIDIDAIKIGMLHRKEIIESVAKILKNYKAKNIVLDPVMVAKSGDALLDLTSICSLKENLFPMTTVLTPNLLEASKLLGKKIINKQQMEEAALELIQMGPEAVIVKGGHLNENCDDCLCLNISKPEIHWFSAEKISTYNLHGTGCTFSAAITAFLAQGSSILEATKQAKNYITQAINAGKEFSIGKGNGPVHHFHHLWK